jgi:predicted O-methyltransferase YrrM
MAIDEPTLRRALERSSSRLDLWVQLLRAVPARQVAEIGVYRGDFAAHVLDASDAIERYYLIDPWRHLDDWNKPANKADDVFERYHRETLEKTAAHAARRVVLRGRTTEVADEIPDGSLDFAYVDGDHTLRGITIDLHRIYPKVREGGWIGGDDFARSIWQHAERFEPTLVFPYAVYFAEAVGARLYALPYNQFLLEKTSGGTHAFVDLAGRYDSLELRGQMAQPDQAPPGAPKAQRREPARGRPATSLAARLRRRLRG